MMSSRNRGHQRFVIDDENDIDQEMTYEWKENILKRQFFLSPRNCENRHFYRINQVYIINWVQLNS